MRHGRLLALAVLACALAFTNAPAWAAGGPVVISQVYGGGGDTDATYLNDYVELHNTSHSTVDLGSWSVQYADTTSGAWQVTNLDGQSIPEGGYLLIEQAGNQPAGAALPTPDVTGTTAMSATAGKVALRSNQTALSCNPCVLDPGIVDLVGYGIGTNDFEGFGAALTPSATTADVRNDAGCTDTDNNIGDFSVMTPAPRNSASTAVVCNRAPEIQLAQTTYTTDEGTQVEFNVGATDADGDPIDLTITDGPAGLDAPTFAVAGNPGTVSGQFDWTPSYTRSVNSPYTITFQADDGRAAPVTANVRINVTDVNVAPELVIGGTDPREVAEANLYSTTVTATDADTDPLTISMISAPTGADAPIYDPVGHIFVWTPGFDRASSTPYDITFQVDDGAGHVVQQTIQITVSNTNRRPLVTIDPPGDKAVVEGQALTFSVTATDPDGDPVTLSQSDIDGPDAPVLTPTGPGKATVSWTPDSTRAEGSPYALRLTASDGALNTDFRVLIVVTEPAPPPATTTTTTPKTAPVYTIPKSTTPAAKKRCVVPKLKGLTLKKAKAKLKKARCRLGKVTKKKGPAKSRGKVIKQKLKAGKKLKAGTKVGVTLGR